MKYFVLLALLGSVNTIDFDGDGIDDTPEDADENEEDGDKWYQDEQYEEFNYDDFAKTKRFTMLSAMNANMTTDTDGTDELGIFKVDLFNDDQFIEHLFKIDLSDDTTSFVSGWKKTYKNEVSSYDFVAEDNCYLRFHLEEIDTEEEEAESVCVNDDSVGDRDGDTCSSFYD
jgi:hypothetical protein